MLTWRSAITFGVGVIVVAVVRQTWFALVPIVVVGLLVAFDLVMAGSLADLQLSRDGGRQIRFGDTATVTLTITNNGVRPVFAEVRDGWVPSAGVLNPVHRVDLAPGASAAIATRLCPTRRGDRPAVRVSIRSYGPSGHAYRQRSLRRAAPATPPWTLRVLPRFDARRLLLEKVAKLRVLDRDVAAGGRGGGTG